MRIQDYRECKFKPGVGVIDLRGNASGYGVSHAICGKCQGGNR